MLKISRSRFCREERRIRSSGKKRKKDLSLILRNSSNNTESLSLPMFTIKDALLVQPGLLQGLKWYSWFGLRGKLEVLFSMDKLPAEVEKVLKLLRLQKLHSGTFVKLTAATEGMLR